jgi:hypothetical protein
MRTLFPIYLEEHEREALLSVLRDERYKYTPLGSVYHQALNAAPIARS